MRDIEFAGSVEIPRVLSIDGIPERPVVGRHRKSMCVSVAEDKRHAMRTPLSHRYLESVIIGLVIVREPIDVTQVGELARKRPSGLLRSGVWAAVIIPGSARKTLAGWTACDRRVPPAGAETADGQRLV